MKTNAIAALMAALIGSLCLSQPLLAGEGGPNKPNKPKLLQNIPPTLNEMATALAHDVVNGMIPATGPKTVSFPGPVFHLTFVKGRENYFIQVKMRKSKFDTLTVYYARAGDSSNDFTVTYSFRKNKVVEGRFFSSMKIVPKLKDFSPEVWWATFMSPGLETILVQADNSR